MRFGLPVGSIRVPGVSAFPGRFVPCGCRYALSGVLMTAGLCVYCTCMWLHAFSSAYLGAALSVLIGEVVAGEEYGDEFSCVYVHEDF